jgi:hypothetical protein
VHANSFDYFVENLFCGERNLDFQNCCLAVKKKKTREEKVFEIKISKEETNRGTEKT